MKRLRIAFLTDEFAGEAAGAGGLGHYLRRISRALRDLGHEVEVFSRTWGEPGSAQRDALRIEAVPPSRAWWARAARRLEQSHLPSLPPETLGRLRTAAALARAFERRHAERPFDFVQSTNCGASGLFLRRRPGLPHLLRLSSLREPWLRADDPHARCGTLDEILVRALERRCARRATRVYAPSRALCQAASRALGIEVGLLRPPAFVECKPADRAPAPLPERFLLHFGHLRPRKGTDLLAEALPRVWEREPGFTMVWAGRERHPGSLARWRERWGARADRVRWLGSLAKPELYAVLQRAEASVLPSRVDNLPNTALESLLFEVPVIATRGASFEELVEPGSGELVPNGDAGALADALVSAWRGEAGWQRSSFRRPPLFDAMRPERAARGLIELALRGGAP